MKSKQKPSQDIQKKSKEKAEIVPQEDIPQGYVLDSDSENDSFEEGANGDNIQKAEIITMLRKTNEDNKIIPNIPKMKFTEVGDFKVNNGESNVIDGTDSKIRIDSSLYMPISKKLILTFKSSPSIHIYDSYTPFLKRGEININYNSPDLYIEDMNGILWIKRKDDFDLYNVNNFQLELCLKNSGLNACLFNWENKMILLYPTKIKILNELYEITSDIKCFERKSFQFVLPISENKMAMLIGTENVQLWLYDMETKQRTIKCSVEEDSDSENPEEITQDLNKLNEYIYWMSVDYTWEKEIRIRKIKEDDLAVISDIKIKSDENVQGRFIGGLDFFGNNPWFLCKRNIVIFSTNLKYYRVIEAFNFNNRQFTLLDDNLVFIIKKEGGMFDLKEEPKIYQMEEENDS